MTDHRTLDGWEMISVDEPDAWDDFVRWVWQRCLYGDGDGLGPPEPPIDAALLALCDHRANCPGERCLTCALADMAHRCPDCDDYAVALLWTAGDHLLVPYDVPTTQPPCEADNFPIVGIGCRGTITPALRTIARDR